VETTTLGYRKALDGLRGLSIVLVYLFHVQARPLPGGFLGVDLFFVLSGFLITTLLLEEWSARGRISLGAFYARRALRLLPALALLLFTLLIVSAAVEPPGRTAAMLRASLITFFYSSNWFLAAHRFPRPELAHTWSLSIEEQFYLVWPVLLLMMLRSGMSRRAIASIVIGAILAVAVLRAWLWSNAGSFERVYSGTDTHSDGLLCGALAAMAATWGAGPAKPARILGLTFLGCLGFLIFLTWVGDPWLYRAGYLPLNLGAACLVYSLATIPWEPLRRCFEFAPLAALGRISYGVYLWHLPAYWLASLLPSARGGQGPWIWPLAITLGAAALSFFAVERPLLRLKRRFEKTGAGPR